MEEFGSRFEEGRREGIAMSILRVIFALGQLRSGSIPLVTFSWKWVTRSPRVVPISKRFFPKPLQW